jgi:wyosine [tRNA(Phe)-imidazoG37] synthetase (radical SAM superfamily)
MAEGGQYIYGPVPSRRLGLSLGVDIVPFKVCALDCIYCQLGRTTEKTIERRSYVGVQGVLDELSARLAQPLEADFVTISGSGEPTLNLQLGAIIDGIKGLTQIPVAVVTNGVLLYMEDVRTDCAKADLVVPSLDAGDDHTFGLINRPHKDITIEKVIAGLVQFREQFGGPIWLEVFLIEGVNTGAGQVAKIKDAIERIHPDKVQLNTAVRPTADSRVVRPDAATLQAIAAELGPLAEIVVEVSRDRCGQHRPPGAEEVLSMLKRRPCSLGDICTGLNIARNHAIKCVHHLTGSGRASVVEKNGVLFYWAAERAERGRATH